MEDEDEEDDEEEGMPHVGRLEVEEEEQFRSDLLVLLLRYQSLDGGGFQCALPPPVFSRLKSLWGVEFEGFASPLNASLGAGRYCSAFADTDAPFGSLGSFFSLRTPLSGSYQLNPPFSLELYDALAALPRAAASRRWFRSRLFHLHL